MKTIVVGVGNPILGDDGVGIHVVHQLKREISDQYVKIEEAMTGGMNLFDIIKGYDKAVIIDAVKSNNGEHGKVKRILLNDFDTIHSCNPHDVSLVEAVEIAKKLGEKHIPKEIVVIGIMMKNTPYEFSEKLSMEVAKAVPKAVEIAINEIKR